jgi:hypothetical protein
MTRAMIRMIVPAAALTVLVLGCGSSGNAGARSLTITVSGSPAARVTDVAGYSLTQKQLNTIIKDCDEDSGVPGNGASLQCRDEEEYLQHLPPCTLQSSHCLIVGRIVGTDLGILQVRGQQSDGSKCANGAGAFCAGVVVPVKVIRPLTGTSSASPSPSVTTTPSGTPSPTVSPSAVITATAPPSTPPSGS